MASSAQRFQPGRATRALAACALALGVAAPAVGGGRLEVFDTTGHRTSPIPGQILAVTRAMRLDDRCIPLAFRMNTSVDSIPNGAGVPPLPLAEARRGIERAMASWNDIPTSYIEMHVVGTTAKTEPRGFDFVNELTFVTREGFPAELTAASFPVTLDEDSLLSHGEDLDGDGDADVSSGILACADVDGDGDIEFPAGSYRAGTVLDTDVTFNPLVLFTTDLSHLDVAWDLEGIAAHELGHSHGLTHSAITQKSPTDGTAATMYNAFRDPIDKAAMRRLHTDDIAWSSFVYPEGSRAHGPGALQRGDIAFERRYSVIRGEVKYTGMPIAGQVVYAEDMDGRVVASSRFGRVRVSLDSDGGIWLLPFEQAIVDGRYELPVPKGTYRVALEPNDGRPEPTLGSAWSGYLATFYGLYNFPEEYYNGRAEDESERRLGRGVPVLAQHDRSGIDFAIERGARLMIDPDPGGAGLGSFSVPGEVNYQALRIRRNDIFAYDEGRGVLVQAALFGTFPWNSSEVATYRSAMITTGRVAADGTATIDIEHPLVVQSPFVGQDNEHTMLYVEHARLLGWTVKHVLPRLDRDLFVVLGVVRRGGFPELGFPDIARDGTLVRYATPESPASGLSYFSVDDGKTWTLNEFRDYSFGLSVAPR